MCSDLLSHLLAVRDPRAERNKLYPLQEIMLLCSCAVLSGAEGWQAIAEFGRAKLPWFWGVLPFANGIPSPDCLGWVFARLPAKGFQECFLAWTRSVAQLSDGEEIAVDGKRLCGSHDGRRGQAAFHLASAWASANRVYFGQVSTQAESNEITAIPELLKLLELKGGIVTIDAVSCQSAIAGQILAQGGD